jgi:uncharacterized 2Fe-2S/4Fe-4S cluster protein (DUF4445 family)
MADAESKTTTEVVFTPSGVRVEADVGATLLDVAWAAGVDIDAPCGGQGRCGRCKVLVESGAVRRRANAKLTPAEEDQGLALACQTVVQGAASVAVPARDESGQRPRAETAAEKIALPFACDWRRRPAIQKFHLGVEPPTLADNTNDLDRLRRELGRQYGIGNIVVGVGALRTLAKALRDADWDVTVTLDMRSWVLDATVPPRLLAVEPGDTTDRNYGLAIDIGTTSVIVYLVDFTDGRVVDVASAYNSQISCGDDVISRIIYSQRSGGLARLQQLVVGTINDLLHEIAGRNRLDLSEIGEVTASGNTTMTHLFLGLDPKYIREEPYIPTISLPPRVSAGKLGINVNPHASVYCMPSVGSYVGGDTTSGVLSSGLFLSDQLTLFIDIGTNGEIVLGNKEWLVSCACSAGPAFEGGGIRSGMRATAGAIEDVWIDAQTLEPTYRTIDDAPPRGICGSGLIDLVAELFVSGVIDKGGRIRRDVATPRVREGLDGVEYVVAWAGRSRDTAAVAVSESDISSLVRAKAAVYAGFSVLCRSVGVRLADVEKIIIGGAFGQYINVEKAIEVGLLPDQPWERFTYMGNTSALGAYTALLCTEMRREVVKIAGRMTYLELSADNTFMDEYTSALFLPHTDLESFPSVKPLLAQHINSTPTRGGAA